MQQPVPRRRRRAQLRRQRPAAARGAVRRTSASSPAAGDAGGALGAALFVWHQLLDKPRAVHRQRLAAAARLLGPQLRATARSRPFLDAQRRRLRRTHDSEDALLDARGGADRERRSVVGWFQGRMEFGPRALGARSIIGDARNAEDAVA